MTEDLSGSHNPSKKQSRLDVSTLMSIISLRYNVGLYCCIMT